jgi:FHA domain/Double zinc ribbon
MEPDEVLIGPDGALMGLVMCAICQEPRDPAGILCPDCGTNLTGAAPVPDDWEPPYGGVERPAEPAPAAEPAQSCPHCGAEVPDPANIVCLVCLRPIAAQPAGGSAALRLVFPAGERRIAAGSELLLGRLPQDSPAADLLAAFDNVSRRHATVGLEHDGRHAWVRDEHSTNGTFVNGVRITAGRKAPLTGGDVLRLAADLSLQVRLDTPDDPGNRPDPDSVAHAG